MIEMHSNYLTYLNKWIKSQSRGGFGIRKKMADFIGVKTSYMSQVLTGTVVLKEDYALKLNEFLRHDPMEADYFILLLAIDRADSQQLKTYYRQKAETLRDQLRLAIDKSKNLVVPPTSTREMDLEDYYSTWHFSATHVLAATQDIDARLVSSRFALPIAAADRIIRHLAANGLLLKKGDKYVNSKKGLHLPKDHRWVGKHHSNWRMKAADTIVFQDKDDLHYTSVATMSHKEMLVVRDLMSAVIRDIRGVIDKAKDEDVYCYTLDLFRI